MHMVEADYSGKKDALSDLRIGIIGRRNLNLLPTSGHKVAYDATINSPQY